MISTPREHSPEVPLEDALEQEVDALPDPDVEDSAGVERHPSVGSTLADPADVLDQHREAPVDEDSAPGDG